MERNVLRKKVLERCEKLLDTMSINKEAVVKVLQKHLPTNPTALSELLKKDDAYLKGMLNLIASLELAKEQFHQIKEEDVAKISALLQLDKCMRNKPPSPPSSGGRFV